MRSPMARRMRREHEEHATEVQLAQTAAAVSTPAESPERRLFFNREISWLDFNDRVLQLAESPDVPLLERVKFCAIYARNLDEFFMIRVARLHAKIADRVSAVSPDGCTPQETLAMLHERLVALGKRHTRCFETLLRPALAEKDRKSTRLNSSHVKRSRMPSSA